MHGRQLRIYRSFSNVCVNANFCVHTWLLSLEEQYRKSKLPPTLYHQIDGGPEKANIHYLAICFMLVAKGLCLKVVLTRLLPGHTHEDIDALFALIWQMVKDEIVLTPSELEAAILKAFNKLKDVKVKDIHAVPNYAKYFEGYCDLSIGRFAKEDWTQLQMTFEKVADAERDRYPLGVKMTYKAYGQDEAIEIVDDPDKESITGLIPQLTLCPVCPADDEPPVCVMLSMPPASRTIEVDPGSRDFTVAWLTAWRGHTPTNSLRFPRSGRSGVMRSVRRRTLRLTILAQILCIFLFLLSSLQFKCCYSSII
jgi:hypothetical protein